MSLEPKFYLKVFRSRFPLFFTVFVAVVAIGVAFAITLPKVYRAHASLLVEGSQIPSDLASSTVRTDLAEQVQVIRQRLLTRDNLLDIAYRFELYADRPDMQPDEIVADMRKRVRMDLAAGRQQATVVHLTAEADNGETAAEVANDLVTQVLKQDASFRTDVATDTLAFFQKEVARLGEQLDEVNRRILEFKNANIDALPETLDYRLGRQALLQERLAQTRREISQLKDQRRRLVELYERTGQVALPTERSQSPEEVELAELQSQLRAARAVLSETNPKVTMLKSRIAQLEATISGREPEAAEEESEDPSSGVIEAQLVEIDSQIETLENDAAALNEEIAELQSTIERSPSNAITLTAMERERDNIQGQYDAAVERLSAAATGERIEVLSKGQRLSVIEHAVVPNSPAPPGKTLIVLGAMAAGLLLGLAAVVLVEILFPRLRRPVELTRKLGITPLGTLPYVEAPGEAWRRNGVRFAVLALVCAGIGGGLWAVDQMVMPLDQLVEIVRAKVEL
ncbi:lipopolysaccharide biosynthesis protein [Vannielia litorea]|uniref:lipopolysaccharide biosynthesis protein n=1 Tax=Vannielia litorea TaxID=1217970 RepID=UPI001C9828AB|nr:lipopolysaccharide biosynthesis protein [Vannielia litorea]MBY6155171.1 lipopolysaccharide biosynthesis protein [Vannielia litorea]